MDVERRMLEAGAAEVRASASGSITGLAAVFNVPSLDLGGFREIILPGAFDRVLADRSLDVFALFNHDVNQVLARTTNGSLKLSAEARGLRATMTLPDTPTAGEVRALVRAGLVTGMSFSFIVARGGDVWKDTPGGAVREVVTVGHLVDVGPVTTPAYPQTEVSARARGGLAAVPLSLLRLRLDIS